MRLTWKDGLATVFVGAAVLLYLLSPSDIWLFGLSGSRGLAVAIFALGVGGVLHNPVADEGRVWLRRQRAPAASVRGALLASGRCHARCRDYRDLQWQHRGAGHVDGGDGRPLGADDGPPLGVPQGSRDRSPSSLMVLPVREGGPCTGVRDPLRTPTLGARAPARVPQWSFRLWSARPLMERSSPYGTFICMGWSLSLMGGSWSAVDPVMLAFQLGW